jgi:RNA polymerase sigma factor (sigma-70 family)
VHVRIESSSRVRLRFASDERLVRLVRDGNRAAFEAIYDRHSASLLSFCVYMLGSHHDAEDAVQATFSSAHRALLRDDRELTLRPWLFVIARNACLSLIRTRRVWVELGGQPALDGDPGRRLEVKEEVRHLVDGLLELPEPQRAALVLSEVQGLSQREISTVMGVRPAQVKAFAYQARSNLIAERRARETDCAEIRETLAGAHGAGRLKGPLRRHLRSCEGCRAYQRGLRRQSRALGALFPVVPSLALKARALQETLENAAAPVASYRGGTAVSGGAAGTVAVAGGGFKAVLAVVAGVACVGACGVGASFLGVTEPSESKSPAASGSSVAGDLRAASYEARVSTSADPGGRSTVSPGRGTAEVRVDKEVRLSAAGPTGPAQRAVGPGAPPSEGANNTAGQSFPPGATAETAPRVGTPQVPRKAQVPRKDPAKRLQAVAERERSIQERRSGRESAKTSDGERRTLRREEQSKAREQRQLAREQQAAERKEHARILHGLPPELRRAEREKERAEREQRKAEREAEATG